MSIDIYLALAILGCFYIYSTIESLDIQNPHDPRDTRYREPHFKSIPQKQYVPFLSLGSEDECHVDIPTGDRTPMSHGVKPNITQRISSYGYTPSLYVDETRFVSVEDSKEPLPVSPDFFMHL